MTRAEAYWILEEIRKESFSADHAEALGIAQETIEFVDLMPEHYAPVVRCKDCKYRSNRTCLIRKDGWGCQLTVGLTDYCSDGERKDGDGNGDG